MITHRSSTWWVRALLAVMAGLLPFTIATPAFAATSYQVAAQPALSSVPMHSNSYIAAYDCLEAHVVLRVGSKGTCVRRVQEWNNHWGVNWGSGQLVVDGNYGPKTERAIKRAQRWWGLTPDGVVGPRTWDRVAYGLM